MIIIDPDVPFPTAGTQERPLLHGLIANIVDGDVMSGMYDYTVISNRTRNLATLTIV